MKSMISFFKVLLVRRAIKIHIVAACIEKVTFWVLKFCLLSFKAFGFCSDGMTKETTVKLILVLKG